jgi:MYXO-CTERM domain-containing protein
MGTCDDPNLDHRNGALFTEDGAPAYCQIMSMHWDVGARETVECGGGECPDTPGECAGTPITYHVHEVVAEVRSFLQYSTHFFAECQAVNAYENTVPNPAWPYLDDEGRTGHYLTTTGDPPACPCEPSDEGDFECVEDGCGPGVDCCLPSNAKERGAGFLIADSPSPFRILRPEVAYMQFDGVFAPQGGSEPAYNLSEYLGTTYKNDRDVTFITAEGGPGVQDVWMTGYLDGECDIDQDDQVELQLTAGRDQWCGGKVSYLGGHSYAGKTGQRLFLNALFEADCVTDLDWDGGGGSDTDGDGVDDGRDPFPNDPERCGDGDHDTCDDCASGAFDLGADGPDADGDGICDAGEDDTMGDDEQEGDGGGCGCRAGGDPASLAALAALAALLLYRRRRAAAPRSTAAHTDRV